MTLNVWFVFTSNQLCSARLTEIPLKYEALDFPWGRLLAPLEYYNNQRDSFSSAKCVCWGC